MGRWVVLGAGGVGGGVGARLQLAGERVVFVARGAHLHALQTTGLHLRQPDGDARLAVEAVPHADVTPADRVLLAVKSQDTAAALATLPPGSTVICAQNGVDNEALAARAGHRVFGMMVWLPATYLQPGEIRLHSRAPAVLDVGAFPWGTAGAEAIAAALRAAGFDSAVHPDIMAWKRAKLLSNLAGALVAAGAPLEDADALVAEGRRCLAAAGLTAPDAALLARCAAVDCASVGGEPRPGGSLWQGIARGTSTEVGALNGWISRLGAAHGVPTPRNDAVVAAVRALSPGA
ncbi:MAG: 2-dehydropantoate 2-reductase [Myxococcales bacterium]|nr:2-dehydropantoate 2-reductase [Myxococcales bacterium]